MSGESGSSGSAAARPVVSYNSAEMKQAEENFIKSLFLRCKTEDKSGRCLKNFCLVIKSHFYANFPKKEHAVAYVRFPKHFYFFVKKHQYCNPIFTFKEVKFCMCSWGL